MVLVYWATNRNCQSPVEMPEYCFLPAVPYNLSWTIWLRQSVHDKGLTFKVTGYPSGAVARHSHPRTALRPHSALIGYEALVHQLHIALLRIKYIQRKFQA